jgi:hypothetical protein
MRRSWVWLSGACLAVACVLPKVETDPSLTAGAGGTAGSGAGGGLPGKGGSGPVAGDAGAAAGDEREGACGDYCTTYIANCADTVANTYDDIGDCLTTCFTSDWPLGTDADEPNSLQCRVFHAHLAATVQDPHCFHSAEFPSKTTCALPAK